MLVDNVMLVDRKEKLISQALISLTSHKENIPCPLKYS